MKKRILVISILVFLSTKSRATNQCSSPLLSHDNVSDEREFQNVYQCTQNAPSIITGSGSPTVAPRKVGDIFIDTGSSKVYIATATATSGSWAILN